MKRLLLIPLLALLSGAPLSQTVAHTVAHTASRFEFSVWMRDIDQKSVSVQKHLQAQRADAARSDARELERLYALMEQYFAKAYPAADAVAVSRDGREQAAAIQQHLAVQNWVAAAKAARAIALACNDCHDPYKPFP